MANDQQGDRRHQNNGQGAVKDAEHDGRLKDKKGGHDAASSQGDDVQPHGQGRVKDPEHDGRLKENR